jgi:hypothetical protein
MDRRSFLSLVGAVAGTATAGCSGGPAGDRTTTPTPDAPEAADSGRETVAGVELPVPREQFRQGVLKDAIPAIVDPAFGPDWRGLTVEYKVAGSVHTSGTIEPRLQPDDRVIGVERNGAARAYPLRLLNHHEIVNDVFDGPLLVTYCPLCGSGVAAERRLADGGPTTFGVSGLLWNSNLVMEDRRTESRWSQIAATAIRGPQTGRQLPLVPATLLSWAEWRRSHPDTEVLLPPPASNTVRGPVAFDYTTDPYSDYEQIERRGIAQNKVPESDAELHPKEQVLGVAVDGVAKAYPRAVIVDEGVVNDEVNGRPVVVTTTASESALVAYDRTVGGETLTFERADAKDLAAGGSRWRITTGEAVGRGENQTRLTRLLEQSQLFWFAWLDFHPDTDVYPE